MRVKHCFHYLCHVVLHVVYSQSNHGLFSYHVLDVEDAALSLEPSSKNFEALVGDPNTATINLEEHLIVIKKMRVCVPVLLCDSIVLGLNCFMSFKE